MTEETLALAAGLLVVAAAYAVGQAGATGYLAVMGLAGLQPAVMKPTALALNILVAAIGTVQFWRAGMLSWRTFYPFAVLRFPFSLIGGSVNLLASVYYPVVGAILLIAGGSCGQRRAPKGTLLDLRIRRRFFLRWLQGAAIGFVSGTTRTGGGILLAPVILAMNWVDLRRTAAVTAAYNLLNSTAALAGAYATLGQLKAPCPSGWSRLASAG